MSELSFLLWLQGLSRPWLDTIMGAITQLGSEYFYMAALCFLYWCVSARDTMRLFILVTMGVYVGGAIKELTAMLRPFQVHPDLIHPRFTETAPDAAFPSAHTEHATIFWGYLALFYRKRWLYILAPIVVLLIAFSRLYLGLHWPRDILGGLIVGLVILGLGYLLLRLMEGMPIRTRFPATLLLGLVPLLFFALFPAPDGARSMGLLLGTILGYQLERRYVGFAARRPLWQQALKMLIGLGGALLLLLGLKALFGLLVAPTEGTVVLPEGALPAAGGILDIWAYEFPTLIRYALVGLWVTLAAPAIFGLLFGREERKGKSRGAA